MQEPETFESETLSTEEHLVQAKHTAGSRSSSSVHGIIYLMLSSHTSPAVVCDGLELLFLLHILKGKHPDTTRTA